MSPAMADSSPCWSDIPLDLLRDISHRLHAVSDYVRFHAVCKSWRETLPPPAHRPAFLPWILSWRDAKGYRKARCIFSSTSLYVPDRRWAIGADDGVAAFCLSTTSVRSNDSSADPFTGAATSVALPPYPYPTTSWANQASGIVTSDGTLLVYAWCLTYMALLHPGDLDWTFVSRSKSDFDYYTGPGDADSCCVVYHDGKIIVQCRSSLWNIMSTDVGGSRRTGVMQDEHRTKVQTSYLVESRGELLMFLIQFKTNSRYYMDQLSMMFRWPPDGDDGDIGSLLDALLVSVYVLQYGGHNKPHWVKKTSASLADRTFFLGQQVSFVVDADRFGIGGCAYFIDRRELYCGPWDTPPVERHRVFKYSFDNHTSELVEQLPLHWNHVPCMWLTPNPAIASNEEIREKLKVKQRNIMEQSIYNLHGQQSAAEAR